MFAFIFQFIKKINFSFFLLFILFLGVLVSPLQANDNAYYSKNSDYRIGPGDILNIEVYGEEDLTKEVRVSETGLITYPLLGQIRVDNMTASQVGKMLHNKLGARFLVNPHVSVFVKRFSEVFVYGEVKKPGSYPLGGQVTVLEAITMAGGLTDVANPRNVKIVRGRNGSEDKIKVNLNDITKKGDKNKDIVLESGDVIVVSKSFF